VDFKIRNVSVDSSGALLVSIEGELDIATAKQLAKPTQVAVDTGSPMILDLSTCQFIDSAGLRAVLHAHKLLGEAHRQMVVVTDRGQVRNLLHVTAIDLNAPVFADLDQAIAWFDGADITGTAQPIPVPPIGGPSTASPNR